MKCIVTGGAGFIGSHVVDLLLDSGMDVTILDNLSCGDPRNLNPKATFKHIDLGDCETLADLSQDADLFFHLAAWPRIQPSFLQPLEHEQANVINTIRCLQAVTGSKIQKFIFSSSCAVYGRPQSFPVSEANPVAPTSPYALQKYAGEQYCMILGRQFDIPVIALRYFNVYGPRSFDVNNPFSSYSSVIGIFANQRNLGQPLTITGDGEQSRDFVHVTDVARANLKAALSNKTLEIYNVGTGIGHSVNQVAALFSDNVSHRNERQGEAVHIQADITKIRHDIGWEPMVSLLDGVADL